MEAISNTALAVHVKEMRDLQKSYFLSRKGKGFGDKQILEASKAKEKEVDALVERIMQHVEPAKPVQTNLFVDDFFDCDPYS